MSIERYGNRGIARVNSDVYTFEIQGMSEREELQSRQYSNIYHGYLDDYNRVRIGGYNVPIWGEGHNLYPQQVFDTTSANKLLPELLEKQKEYLFGKGPYLYREEMIDGNIERIPVKDDAIQRWLDSWEKSGLKSVWDYLMQCIDEYYHVCTIPTQYHFFKSRRIMGDMPIVGLSCMGSEQTRLACDNLSLVGRMRDSDCTHVMVGDWLNPSLMDFEVYDRFDPSNPYKSATTISFVKNKTFTKDVYAYNKWFKGLEDWIRGANLNPKFINSYLKNALNARVHVLIPGAWYLKKEQTLQNICLKNIQNSELIQREYLGVVLVDDQDRPLPYQDWMMNQLIDEQLRHITSLMSGEGKNQGKLWASLKFTTGSVVEEWEFKEIPSNYKEFITSLLEYDKRADQVIIAGRGIPSSISNVEKDGIISRSGNDVYYSYMIYIDTLTIPEYHTCLDINRAIAINFPKKQGIKVGLYHRIPRKLQEITPDERPQNTIAA